MKWSVLSLFVISTTLLSAFFLVNNSQPAASQAATLSFGRDGLLKPQAHPAFKGLSKVEQRRMYAAERRRWEFELLKDPATGTLPADAAQLRAQVLANAARNKNPQKRVESLVSRGPGNLGGRTRAIVFDQSDASGQTILAGGVSSGLFRTENRGQTWVKVSAQDEMHNVTSIAQDPRNPNVWYYGTGELSGNSAAADGAAYYGDGVWRSEDGGRTWAQVEATAGNSIESRDSVYDYVSKLVVHPTTSDLYISSPQGIYRLRADNGNIEAVLSSSLPRYTSWDMHDIEILPDGSAIYVAISSQVGRNRGIYRSTTGDFSSYELLVGGQSALPPEWPRDSGRVDIAVDTQNNFLYVLTATFYQNDCDTAEELPEAALLRMDLSTRAWTDLSANLPNDGDCLSGNNPFTVQGGYDVALAIAPNNPDRIYIGGTNLFVSDDAFRTNTQTRRIGGYARANSYGSYENHHPDIHVVTFDPTNPDIIISGTDGGIHSALVGSGDVAWDSLNNDYVTYQYYHVAVSPRRGDNFAIGGAQDNGTTGSIAGTFHQELAGGDGVSVAIGDYVTVDGEDRPTFYLGFQFGDIYRYDGQGFAAIRPTDADNGLFVTYFRLDPDNTDHLYYASNNRLYFTDQALTVTEDTWLEHTALGALIGTETSITAMATSRGTYAATSKLYVGTDDARLIRLDDPRNTTAPNTPIVSTLPAGAGTVSSIAVDPDDDNKVLVTISNYKVSSAFYSENAGDANPTWLPVEGNIAQLSFRSCAIVNDREGPLYLVGTSAGLWSTRALVGNNGTQWQREGLDLIGSAVVSSMALRPNDNNLIIGTHGNGMFQAKFSTDGAITSTQPNRYFLADIRTDNGFDTYVGIVNSHSEQAAVEIFAYAADGSPIGQSSAVTDLAALAADFQSVGTLFPGISGIAWLQVASDRSLSVFAETRSQTTRAAYRASVSQQQVFLPHIATDLVNFETVVNVANPEQNETNVTLTGYPANQNATINRAAGPFGFSSQPITDHLGTDLAPGSWGELNATGTGFAAMEYFTRLPNRSQTAALGLDQQSGNTLNFLHVATDTNQFWTGMVYINLGTTAADVTETYFNAAGEVLKATPRNLTPQQKITLLFDFENQEEVPAGTAWVQVTGDQPLIGYALFGAPSIANHDYFTGLQGNYGGGRAWLYPYFKSSNDRFTGLVAVNLGDEPADLTFTAYDAAGTVLESRTLSGIGAKTKYVATAAGLFENPETLSRGAWVEARATGSEWAGFVLWGDQGATSRQYLAGIQADPIP